MPKHICFLSLTHTYDDNRIFQKEARTLAEAGYRVTHIAPGTGKNFTQHGVHVHFYPRTEGATGRLRRFFNLLVTGHSLDADYYHCNEMESWLAGWILKLLKPGRRIVFDVHEHYPSRFDDPRFPGWLNKIGEPLILGIFRLLTPWTDHFIYAKRSVAGDFQRLPGVEDKGTFVFNYGPLWLKERNLTDVAPEIRQKFSQGLTAVHVGVFAKIRGWPQLLKAMSMMKNRHMNLIALGRVDEGKDAILAEAARLNIQERIQILDRIPYEEMFDYLLCADIGLMLYQPGVQNHIFAFPIKMYDYMLAGLPVIGPDFAVEVVPVIQENSCGILVDTSDPMQIVEALDLLCEDREEAIAMGLRGREAVLREYHWETQIPQLLAVYDQWSGRVTP